VSDAAAGAERVFRAHGPRLLALLARELRSIDAAEDALQDAHVAALRQWTEREPANPAGWLLTVARRRARDRLRRDATLARKLPLLVVEDPAGGMDAAPAAAPVDEAPIADERLRMIFTACHPALSPEARVALTLRYALGLATAEVARLFHVAEPAMAARLTRAKRKIAAAGIPYRVPAPADLPGRRAGVLAVVYLVFTEGHAPARGGRVVRGELCAEAIRLARLLRELIPGDDEVTALLALMLLTHARSAARTAADGSLVVLCEQDRGRWDRALIDEGLALIATVDGDGAYALQARIAAEHATAPDTEGTNWSAIADRYAALEAIQPTPAVRLNRAVAVAEVHGPRAGLALLEGLDAALGGGHALHTARAELLLRAGDVEAADEALGRAASLAGNAAVREHLVARRADVSLSTRPPSLRTVRPVPVVGRSESAADIPHIASASTSARSPSPRSSLPRARRPRVADRGAVRYRSRPS